MVMEPLPEHVHTTGRIIHVCEYSIGRESFFIRGHKRKTGLMLIHCLKNDIVNRRPEDGRPSCPLPGAIDRVRVKMGEVGVCRPTVNDDVVFKFIE